MNEHPNFLAISTMHDGIYSRASQRLDTTFSDAFECIIVNTDVHFGFGHHDKESSPQCSDHIVTVGGVSYISENVSLRSSKTKHCSHTHTTHTCSPSGAGPGRTSTASCGKEAWASTRTARAPAAASRITARCPSAWARPPARSPATTRRGNMSSNWGGQSWEERREETEQQQPRCETCCLTVAFVRRRLGDGKEFLFQAKDEVRLLNWNDSYQRPEVPTVPDIQSLVTALLMMVVHCLSVLSLYSFFYIYILNYLLTPPNY